MPDMSEASVYKALGLSAPEAQGEQAQEPAAPAEAQPTENEPTQGVQEQEPAEPAEGGSGTSGEDFEEASDDTPVEPAEDGKKELTTEERRANAARRRQQEQQAAIDSAVANARREEQQRSEAALTDLFARVGMKNTFTGEAITNMEQFEAWQKQYRDTQLQQELAEGKLTVDRLNELVAENPIVKQAQAVLQQNQPQETQNQQDAARQAADNARIEQEIAEISKLDPSVKNLGDILNGPKGKEFYDYVRRGYSFLDAYRVANFERLTTAKAQAARQQAAVQDRGKAHLKGTNGTRGTGALSVPNADMAMFRAFNPTATEAEIQAYYNKYMKGR